MQNPCLDTNPNTAIDKVKKVMDDSKKIAKRIFVTLNRRLFSISKELADAFTTDPGGEPTFRNEFLPSRNKLINESYEGAVGKNTNLASNVVFTEQTIGGANADELMAEYKVNPLSSREAKENYHAKNSEVMKELLKGDSYRTPLGKALAEKLAKFNLKYTSKNNLAGDLAGTTKIEPLIDWNRVTANKEAVSAELKKARDRSSIKTLDGLLENRKISQSQYNELKQEALNTNEHSSRNAIDSLSNKEEAVAKFESDELPSKRAFLDINKPQGFSDPEFIDYMVDNDYFQNDPRAVIENHLHKTVKGSEFNRRFAGYTAIRRDSAGAANISRLKKSYANNVLGISKNNLNTLINLKKAEVLNRFTRLDKERANIAFTHLGDKLPDWLDIADSVVKPDGSINTPALFDALTQKGYMRDAQNRAITDPTITQEHGFLYDPTVNLEAKLNRIKNDKGVDAHRESIELVKNILQRRPNTLGKNLQTTQSILLSYGNSLRLAFSTLSSFAETMGVATKAGGGRDMLNGMVDTFKHMYKNLSRDQYDKSMNELLDIGILGQNSYDLMAGKYLDNAGLEKGAQKAMNHLFHINGQEAWVRYIQGVNLQVSKNILSEWGRRAINSVGREQSEAMAGLKALGVTAEEINGWDGVVKNGFDLIGRPGEEIQARRNVQNALYKFVDEGIVRPTPSMRYQWSNDPRFALLWNLKSYIVAHSNRVIMPFFRNLRKMYEDGHTDYTARVGAETASPLGFGTSKELGGAVRDSMGSMAALATLYMPLAYMGWKLRELIQYSLFNEKAPSEQNPVEKNLLEVADRSALMGNASMVTHLFTGQAPIQERIAGTISPTFGHVARLLRPDNKRLASFAGEDTAAKVNNTMKMMTLIPVVNQLPGYKMQTAKRIVKEGVQKRKEQRKEQRRNRSNGSRVGRENER